MERAPARIPNEISIRESQTKATHPAVAPAMSMKMSSADADRPGTKNW